MYTENEKAIIWLSLFDSLTYIKTAKLVALYQEPKQIILNFTKKFLHKFLRNLQY